MKARWITDHDPEEITTELVLGCHLAEIDDVYDNADAEAGVRITEDEARWLYELLKARFAPVVVTPIPIPGLDPEKWKGVDSRLIGVTGVTLTPDSELTVTVNDKPVHDDTADPVRESHRFRASEPGGRDATMHVDGGVVTFEVKDRPDTPPVAANLQGVITRIAADPMVESAMAMNRLAAVHACEADKPVIEEAVLVINLLREELDKRGRRG